MAGHSYYDPNYDPGIFNVYFTQDPSTGVCTNFAINCMFGTAGVLNCYSRTQTFRCELQLRVGSAGDVVSIGSNWPNPQPDGNGEGPDNSGDHHVNLGSWTYTPTTWELQNGQLNIQAWAVTIDDTGTRAPGNCSGYISTTHHFTPPDSTPPTINITLTASETSSGPYYTTGDSSAKIKVQISDSETGPKSFNYDIIKYEYDGSSLTENSRTNHSHTGSQVEVPLDPVYIIGVDVSNAQDVAGNPSVGTAQSRRYAIATVVNVVNQSVSATAAVSSSNCSDMWDPSFPQDGLVTFAQLKATSTFKSVIASHYGISVADVEKCLDWVRWITQDNKNSTLHAGLGGGENASNPPTIPYNNWYGGKNKFRPWLGQIGDGTTFHGVTLYGGDPGSAIGQTNSHALNGRAWSGGWYSGLYGRGQDGDSQYTAVWLGSNSANQFMPQPIAEHMYEFGRYWGYSTHGGLYTGNGGIRGPGTDWGGKSGNAHRRRDDFILEAIHAWNPGSKYPGSSSTTVGSMCGMDLWLKNSGIEKDASGKYLIKDCRPPINVNLSVKSATVLAGNGKEYYIDYAADGHKCHFEVEAQDDEYGLANAVFRAFDDTSPSTPTKTETKLFSGAAKTLETSPSFWIDTDGLLEVWCEVDVYDLGGNFTTVQLTPLNISIDDGEPQGGLVGGSGQTNATNSTTTPGIKLDSPDYMVGTKPYYNSKNVDIFIEYEDEYSGVDEAKLYINGNVELQTPTLPQLPTATPHAQVHNISGGNLREGINNAQLWLKDLATNEWFSGTLDFYIDETEPEGLIEFSSQYELRKNNGALWTKENDINVDLWYTDPGPDPSGIDKGEIGVGSTPASHTMTLAGSSMTDHNVTGLSIGSNDIYFTVIDKVEWTEVTTDMITVHVDQTNPTGSIVMNSGQTINTVNSFRYVNTTGFNVDLTHDDSDSGLF